MLGGCLWVCIEVAAIAIGRVLVVRLELFLLLKDGSHLQNLLSLPLGGAKSLSCCHARLLSDQSVHELLVLLLDPLFLRLPLQILVTSFFEGRINF